MKKKKFSVNLLASLLVICFSVFALSSYAQDGKSMTLKGEILDMSCYMSSGAHGSGHKDCAAKCIKEGSPMGLLASDGKVYILVENHNKKDAYSQAKNYAGEQITITGTYSDRGGVPGLIVDEVKGNG